jgi:hypothetical protein
LAAGFVSATKSGTGRDVRNGRRPDATTCAAIVYAASRIPEQPATALSGTPSMLACDAPTGQDCASGSIYLSTSSGSVAT